jgi:hypothetical protein
MEYQQLIDHFGGQTKTARALGTTKQTVHAWGARNRVPASWQLKAEAVSRGKLQADPASRRQGMEFASWVYSSARRR